MCPLLIRGGQGFGGKGFGRKGFGGKGKGFGGKGKGFGGKVRFLSTLSFHSCSLTFLLLRRALGSPRRSAPDYYNEKLRGSSALVFLSVSLR
jgi:hypothetical protein